MNKDYGMVLLHRQCGSGTIFVEMGGFWEDGLPTFQFQVGEGGCVLTFEVADEQVGASMIGHDDTIPTLRQLVFQRNKTLRHLLSLLGVDVAVIDKVSCIYHLSCFDRTWSV